MKRLDLEPTKDALLESLQLDSAGRNQDAIDFIKMLAETEGPYSYMIDATWGDGKTFFVKSIELILEALNPRIEGTSIDEIGSGFALDELKESGAAFLPFYFNAWSNDFVDDPITALFASMAVEFERKDLLRVAKLKEGIASIVDAALSLTGIPLGVAGIAKAFTSESVIPAFKGRAELRSQINALCDDSIEEVADKLVIFIDELDRCRPDFAVRLLEQTKNLFSSSNIILVFAADSAQLAKAVAGMYGAGFDSMRFLERFFDERVTMSPVDSYSFTHDGRSLASGNRFDKLVSEIYASREFTIRDSLRIKRKLDSARSYCLNSSAEDLAHLVAHCTVLPMLVFIEQTDIALFRSITSGADVDALFKYGKAYPAFINNIKDAIERSRRSFHMNEEPSLSMDDCEDYMHNLCIVIYGGNRSYSERFEAEERVGVNTAFNKRAFVRLKFD